MQLIKRNENQIEFVQLKCWETQISNIKLSDFQLATKSPKFITTTLRSDNVLKQPKLIRYKID